MASSKSLLTIEISSIINRSSEAMIRRFSLPKSNLLLIRALGTYGVKGSWKKEWMVIPPALMAATPVGATTIDRFLLCSTTVFKKVVLPVPALPVRKILRPVCSTKSHAMRSSSFVFVSIVLEFKFNIFVYLSMMPVKILPELIPNRRAENQVSGCLKVQSGVTEI